LQMIRIFYIAVLVLASLAGWGQQGMLLAVPADGEALLLDTYTGATVGHSVHKISSTATNCVTIQRASDNDTLVVGFSGDDFDSASALAFVSGADNGYVRTWWDQSGNDYHMTQTDTSLMPMIIQGGALITLNGNAAVHFDGVNDYLVSSGAAQNISTDYTQFAVMSSNGIGNDYLVAMGNSADNTPIFTILVGAGGTPYAMRIRERTSTGEAIIDSQNSVPGTQYLFSKKVGSSDHQFIQNDGTAFTDNTAIGTISADRYAFGALVRATVALHANCNVQCVIMYASDESADISNINTEINNYYSIY